MYCMYLRKSRGDSPNEPVEETLSRHEEILTKYATSHKLDVVKQYKEVVTGESIAIRPQMQAMLQEIQDGKYEGVIVIEIERLGRGNPIDQGIICETFKYSNTKIITPTKIYDLSNENDEEYSEFGLFMSRREYKTINKRLQRGRKLSQEEGKFVGSVTPYGYKTKKLKKGYSLEPNNEESDVLKKIFDMFTVDRLGVSIIANKLNDLCIPTRKGKKWSHHTIRDILTNEVYIGMIRSGKRKITKQMKDGKIVITRGRNNVYNLIKGLHEPLITNDVFNKAKEILAANTNTNYKYETTLQNPMAGLIKCKKCGKAMIRRPYPNRKASLICSQKWCNNKGIDIDIVEEALVEALRQQYDNLQIIIKQNKEDNNNSFIEKSIKKANIEIKKLKEQREKLCDLVEQGAYSIELFKERESKLTKKITQMEDDIKTLTEQTDKENKIKEFSIKWKNTIDLYCNTDDIQIKNTILKEIIEKIEYNRDEGGRWVESNNFTLDVHPKI